MNADRRLHKLPVDGFLIFSKIDSNLQIMFKDHIPHFIPLALAIFELSCSQTDRHNSKIVFFGLREVSNVKIRQNLEFKYFGDYNTFSLYTSYARKEKPVGIGVVWSGMLDIQPVPISITPFGLTGHKSSRNWRGVEWKVGYPARPNIHHSIWTDGP
ncbi:hypothetical protein AVEN_105761-1 [Araneus ventricosus]|uniref:Uncharacterized protein n=1 Tax=Araneus ventricosus TaxID=182803 RepID=A0A4Y2VQZ8_ARAVE|nr:hypothetical protein AVEN_76914-1 [Araneus ventricosus]GBO26147.1 hypothetical protein AVEN_105761-1 [Araneus ventricosus]